MKTCVFTSPFFRFSFAFLLRNRRLCARRNYPHFVARLGASSPIGNHYTARIDTANFDQIIERALADFVGVFRASAVSIGSLIQDNIALRIGMVLQFDGESVESGFVVVKRQGIEFVKLVIFRKFRFFVDNRRNGNSLAASRVINSVVHVEVGSNRLPPIPVVSTVMPAFPRRW